MRRYALGYMCVLLLLVCVIPLGVMTLPAEAVAQEVVAEEVIDTEAAAVVLQDSLTLLQQFGTLPGWLVGWLIFASLVCIGAMVAAATPNRRDDKIFGWLLRLVDVIGLNVGGARNANRRE